MAGLEISPAKVGFVIVKAREIAAKVAAWDDGATSDHDADSILESFSDDATQDQLRNSFATSMSTSRRAWSRWPGSAEARLRQRSWMSACHRARRAEQPPTTICWLPLLPDYLEEGLERLGYSVEDAEDEALERCLQTMPSCPAEVPGIHECQIAIKVVDGRDKPGHDEVLVFAIRAIATLRPRDARAQQRGRTPLQCVRPQ
jgi:hypothetical protein